MIGENITRVREVLGIKQDELAKKLKTSQQMVSKLEKKEKISDDYLSKIATALGVSPETIKQFNEESLVTSFNQQGGVVNGININPIEAVIKIYEEKLQAKDKKIQQLENRLARVNKK